MLSVRNLSKSFDGRTVLDSIDLDINRGEIFTILGDSGCGKTTLLRILAGLETPDRGRITLDTTVWADVGKRTLLPPQKRGIGRFSRLRHLAASHGGGKHRLSASPPRRCARRDRRTGRGCSDNGRPSGFRAPPRNAAFRRTAAAGRHGKGAGTASKPVAARRTVQQSRCRLARPAAQRTQGYSGSVSGLPSSSSPTTSWMRSRFRTASHCSATDMWIRSVRRRNSTSSRPPTMPDASSDVRRRCWPICPMRRMARSWRG